MTKRAQKSPAGRTEEPKRASKPSWQIIAVPNAADGFRWVWEQTADGVVTERSATSYKYYNECVEDAQKRGYSPPRVERLR